MSYRPKLPPIRKIKAYGCNILLWGSARWGWVAEIPAFEIRFGVSHGAQKQDVLREAVNAAKQVYWLKRPYGRNGQARHD